ncbi:MAG: hypothetical protein NXH70_14640 [Hyphomonas sp.]|jgi:hypothetical protein|nr:hypothetical protein [Henriciella sp.]MBO6694421.1 hypothetical protein [Henriciella sp.]MCH9751171.1 hypothetical protein [Alphaproteobacteria bacterium]MCR9225304.1 hypothetical protein [Hyphomonas sp.]
MRSVLLSVLLASSLGACATVSMVSSEAVVETGLSSQQSSLREVSDAYTDMAEREKWVAKSGGLLGFARVLMDGASDNDATPTMKYTDDLQAASASRSQQVMQLRGDIESATHGLNVATMEAEKLFGTEMTAKRLRADLVSYESALVTAKKARRTFVGALTEYEQEELEGASDALTAFDNSIDSASDAADKLADYAADRKRSEATS